MKRLVSSTTALVLALYGGAALATKPHIHGVGTLQLVLEGNQLHVELSLPAMDVVGFEHAPRTAEQRDAVTQAVALLENSNHVLEPPAAAGCTAAPGRVESALLEDQQKPDPHGHGHGHGHDHDHADEEVHADFDVTYRFDCRRPEALSPLAVTLFQHLPHLERLDVQSVTPGGQRSQPLAPGQTSIALP
jgi:hypothetical protein